ncbi:unnamed protein product [Calicophoron daubneyi]|uniref:Glycerate kinase n=1 Tax=Calicophoron daubneyi TaxID=300641 RepID=A0AAV2TVE7_CALDB
MIQAKELCLHAFNFAVESVRSERLVDKSVRLSGSFLCVKEKKYLIKGRLVLFSFGKAALGMTRTLVENLWDKLETVICCIPKPEEDDYANTGSWFGSTAKIEDISQKIKIFYGSRANLPTDEVVRGSELMFNTAKGLTEDDLLLVCITGGGSALLTLPKQFGQGRLALEDLLSTIKLVSGAGADICELNSVRSCLDELKAGGLAIAAHPAQVVSLIISDVIGDPIQYIASGPTVVTNQGCLSDRINRCLDVLEKYSLLDKIPTKILQFLSSQKDLGGGLDSSTCRVDNWVLGNNRVALDAAAYNIALLGRSGGDEHKSPSSSRTPPDGSYFVDETGGVAFKPSILFPVLITAALQGSATEQGKRIAELLWLTGFHLSWVSENHILSQRSHSPWYERMRFLVNQTAGCTEQPSADTEETLSLFRACDNAVENAFENKKPVRPFGVCMLFGGEANVEVEKSTAVTRANGGRCSHLALVVATRWYELRSEMCTMMTPLQRATVGLLAGASDGLDGPRAGGGGAWVQALPEPTIRTQDEYREAIKAVCETDSYTFLQRYQPSSVIKSRLTGTNVMDIFLGLVFIDNQK